MKITPTQLRQIVKEELQLASLNEAKEVKFYDIEPERQKQIKAFEKLIGARHSHIFDGIHGMIVDIKAEGIGRRYRFDADVMRQLIALKARWVEAGDGKVSVGF